MTTNKTLLLLTLSIGITINAFSQKWIMFCAQDEKAFSEYKHALVNFFETKEAAEKYVTETASFGYNPIIGLLSHVMADGTWMANPDFRKDRMCVVEVSENEYNSCMENAKKSKNKRVSNLDDSYISLVSDILATLPRVKRPKSNTGSVFDFLQEMKTLNKGVDEKSYALLSKATGKTPFYPLFHYLGYWEGTIVNPRTHKSEEMSFDIRYPDNSQQPIIVLYQKENSKVKADTLTGRMQGILLEVPFKIPASNNPKKFCEGFIQIQSRGLNQIQGSFAVHETWLQGKNLACSQLEFIGNKKTNPVNPTDILSETKETRPLDANFKIDPKHVTLSTDKDFRWYKWNKAPEDLKTATRFVHTYTNRDTRKEVTLYEEISKKVGSCEAEVAFIDLNEDGIAGIAVSYGGNCCGTLGCSYDIFENGGLLTTGSDNAHGLSPARNGIKINDGEFVKLVSNPAINSNPELARPFAYSKSKNNKPNIPTSEKRTGAPTPPELGRVLLNALKTNNKKLWISCIHPETDENFTKMITDRLDEWREDFMGRGIEKWNLVTFSRVIYTPRTENGEKKADNFAVEFYYNNKEFLGTFHLCAAKTYKQQNYFTVVPCFPDVQFKRK